MPPEAALSDIAQTIDLAIAPVFLLSGVGVFLGVLTNRLARTVDRTRQLEEGRGGTNLNEEQLEGELHVLGMRRRLINQAIGRCTFCALLIASVIAALFIGAVTGLDVTGAVAVAFVVAMVAFIVGLLDFLREVRLAIQWLRESERRA